MRSARAGLEALREALLAEGGTVAQALGEIAGPDELDAPGPAQIAAAGPRAARDRGQYELMVEMILEGSRLHYGAARLVRSEDADLALLLGDQLYALGLARLAAIGDLDAVAELADVISLVAQAHARHDHELAEAVWLAGAVAVGWGAGPAHEAAKALARDQQQRALEALRQVAGMAGPEAARGPRRAASSGRRL